MTTDNEQRAENSECCADSTSPFTEIQELVGEFVDGMRSFSPRSGARFPRYDVREAADAYLVHFDLPGVPRSEIEIRTEGDQVIVSGSRTRPALGDSERMRREERPFGPFRRVVRAPADVDLGGVRASLDAGVLTVTLPRRVDQQGRRVDIDS